MNVSKVFIVDSNVSLFESLRALVQAIKCDVECFESSEDFLASWTDPAMPCCMILDTNMPGMNGLELQLHLVNQGVRTPIIVVSDVPDIRNCVTAMKQGAFDFIEKPFRKYQLQSVISRAIETDRVRRLKERETRQIQERFRQLTSQENAVLKLMVEGVPNKEIASELDISLRTVQFRRSNIMSKLDVKTRAELVRLDSKREVHAEIHANEIELAH